MNKKITIPENTRVIIDSDVIIFEGKESKEFKPGWYKNKEFGNLILCKEDGSFCGFGHMDGVWYDEMMTPIIQRFELSDMEEVVNILMDEAIKRDYSPNQLKFINGDLINEHGVVFSEGKWHNIKKPLYTNQYGTEFFEDSDYCYVEKSSLEINKSHMFGKRCEYPLEDDNWSEVMTEPECYRYIYENWDKLKKD